MNYIYTNIKFLTNKFYFCTSFKKNIKYCRVITLFLVFCSCQTNNKEIKINGNVDNFEVVRLDKILSKNIDEIHRVYLKYPELYKKILPI